MEAPESLWEWITAGNAPAYLAVVGAVAAATIAWRSLQASKRSAAAAQQQIARLERLDERDQASKFSVWVKEVSTPYENLHPSFKKLDFRNLGYLPVSYTLAVRNSSEHSIYCAIVFTWAEPPQHPEADIDLLPVGILSSIPPSEGNHSTYESQCLATFHSQEIGVAFIDAQGREWERTPTGELVACPPGTFENFRDQLFSRYCRKFPSGDDPGVDFLLNTAPLAMQLKTASDADVSRTSPDQ